MQAFCHSASDRRKCPCSPTLNGAFYAQNVNIILPIPPLQIHRADLGILVMHPTFLPSSPHIFSVCI
ncbi:hypothetical protein XELAEV_18024151mg [Xenopus laevis]|uniref:Uncharacterized protein n=1 Tax=Xenopus laevis TaxID=8355 RepID=A0A974HQ93_XENLA|nr:hypothetical protein XELAEV_18024151mg [Xenopus laevis]